MHTGSCLCGAVTFEVTGKLIGPSVCHCNQCRKQSGHLWASAYVPESQIKIQGAPTWHASSDTAKRGFCPTCGSFLFWKANAENTVSFALGALESPTGLQLEKHIFTAHKGDYYDIADNMPCEENP